MEQLIANGEVSKGMPKSNGRDDSGRVSPFRANGLLTASVVHIADISILFE